MTYVSLVASTIAVVSGVLTCDNGLGAPAAKERRGGLANWIRDGGAENGWREVGVNCPNS